MRINPVQAILASFAILGAAVLAEVLTPRELLATTQAAPNLEQSIPKNFGQWHLVPGIGLVTPSEPATYLEDASTRIYSQELARGYADANGNVVMFLVAYGPVQNFRLKAHLPEMCYNAAGFRVSGKTTSYLSYQTRSSPLKISRLTATRENRLFASQRSAFRKRPPTNCKISLFVICFRLSHRKTASSLRVERLSTKNLRTRLPSRHDKMWLCWTLCLTLALVVPDAAMTKGLDDSLSIYGVGVNG